MNILKVFVLLVTGGAALLGVELSEHVHSARWKVKTLEDAFVVSAPAVPTTIPEQAALPMPQVNEDVTRLPSEKTLYQLDAQLISVKKEFDGDYHLVLQDPETKIRMVAEIPDTNASEPIPYRKEFIAARETVDQIAGHPGFLGKHLPKTVMVQITGIGFFDEEHMLTPNGMMPNDREIHPVLNIRPM